MTSVQERLQLKRMALDNWSTREKLCLASAVSCSGDQNWMSVSRSLKMLYGSNRPADWFSQKSCAVQYGELLENVETPKRKKRSLSDNQAITETPTESILRKLTQERVAELKTQIQKDQEDYAKLREEIMLAQNSNATEAQLKEMWALIEQEQEQKVNEQQKYTQWLKEREERKTELQRAWRPGSFSQTQSSPSNQKLVHLNTSLKQEEMEVDEANPKHGTAPLLTSLLKSPSPAPSSTVAPSTPVSTTSVRISAPTITNLLTGTTSTEITTIPAPPPTPQYHPIHTQPLTGPIPADHHQQIIPSPSQAAPTLSMLLESKAKEVSDQQNQVKTGDLKTDQAEAMEIEDGGSSPNKDDDQQLMEVFNGLIPDNIDELADILTNNNAIILNPELLEEESILEDVESLMDDQGETSDNHSNATGTDEGAQQQEQQSTGTESKNLPDSSDSTKIKDEIKEENENSLDPLKIPKIEDSSGGGTVGGKDGIEVKTDSIESGDNKPPIQEGGPNLIEVKEEKNVEKVESSDDSSDNATLQTIKEKIQVDNKTEESEQDNEDDAVGDILLDITTDSFVPQETINASFGGARTDATEPEKLPEQEDVVMSEPKPDLQPSDSNKITNETSEVIILTEDSDSNDTKVEVPNESKEEPPPSPLKHLKQAQSDERISSENMTTSQQNSTSANQKDFKVDEDPNPTMPEPTTTITIIDIDDDDAPIEVIKDDKLNKNKRDYSRTRKSEISIEKKSEDSPSVEENKQNLNIRKLKDRDGSESPLVDDDNADTIPRTRRRYSSTPVIDSIPSSPASSDDREYKAWKKSILMVYNRIATHRHASIFLRPVTDDVAPNYRTIVLRPMDLHTIKKNIENGTIRTTIEFQRDVMLMCQNAIMFNKRENNVYTIAREMMAESVSLIDSLVENVRRENEKLQSSSLATKGRGRKSHRLP